LAEAALEEALGEAEVGEEVTLVVLDFGIGKMRCCGH
jgi:hypothetical protein